MGDAQCRERTLKNSMSCLVAMMRQTRQGSLHHSQQETGHSISTTIIKKQADRIIYFILMFSVKPKPPDSMWSGLTSVISP